MARVIQALSASGLASRIWLYISIAAWLSPASSFALASAKSFSRSAVSAARSGTAASARIQESQRARERREQRVAMKVWVSIRRSRTRTHRTGSSFLRAKVDASPQHHPEPAPKWPGLLSRRNVAILRPILHECMHHRRADAPAGIRRHEGAGRLA